MISIGIPVYQGVDLLDVTGPHEVLSWAGKDIQTRIIAESVDVAIVSRDGFSFNAQQSFAQEQQFDVIWVPGGEPEQLATMMRGGAYLDFLKSQAKGAQWVCSVCEGALLLAAAGLLDGHKATTHYYFIPCLKSFAKIEVADGTPRFVVSQVASNGNRLTGGGISSCLDESLELVRLLKGEAVARGAQRAMQYYPEAPYPNDMVVPPNCRYHGLSHGDLAGP